ncbi:DUF4333 domain-containing protein [Streptomyces alkaliterrae]|uniref:DUF4333 domain-containing protein n=1 Tax=Streptomyces alkaliterrae TaxID=2213162 RepID=A0A7W3WG91_9ACTN|nr:DUF4333 domain-containing protein [Streptomyces alkaliterrae]MBB1251823.1 DUF4333 domain-containing protein [Streptomyces alkaliterrae]MBB1259535.1 DUF4333 domain-containing protein [Streptomyces alkaliterrae]
MKRSTLAVLSLVGGLAFVAAVLAVLTVPRLLSSESTSQRDTATGHVPRAEVERQIRANYGLPVIEKKPREVRCEDELRPRAEQPLMCEVTLEDGTTQNIAVSVTGTDGERVSYDYVLLEG